MSCRTCLVLSAITSRAETMVRYVGPYLSQWRRWARREDCRCTNTMEKANTTMFTKKAIQCPRNREALVTLPPRSGITSAGQHHAPIRAGTESTSVANEMMSPLRSAAASSPRRASLLSSGPQPSSPPPGSRRSRSSRGVSCPEAGGPHSMQSSCCAGVPRCERGTYAHAMTSPFSPTMAADILRILLLRAPARM